MENKILDDLVSSSTIKAYRLVSVDENGIEEKESSFRTTERLVLTFLDDRELVINTFCSGRSETTCFIFDTMD